MPPVSQWPDWHDPYIADHYPSGDTKDIAQHLGRPVRHIHVRAFAQGVKKNKDARAWRKGAFSPEIDALLRLKYADYANAELEAETGLSSSAIAHRGGVLGLKKTAASISRAARDSHTPHTGLFTKGFVPWNKGIKGYSVKHGRHHFQPGTVPSTWVPVGTERWTQPPKSKPDAPRYLKRKVAEPNRWAMAHRWLWEQHNGPIPKGYIVLFRDGDTTNIAIENLMCITRQDQGVSNGHKVPPELVDVFKLTRQLAQAIQEQE